MSYDYYHKIICSRQTFDEYLFDRETTAEYGLSICFDKVFGMRQKWYEYVYKADIKELDKDTVELYFSTQKQFPARAIALTLLIRNDVEWQVVGEEHIQVFHFYWDKGLKSRIAYAEKALDRWCNELGDETYYDLWDELDDEDDILWEYMRHYPLEWKPCNAEEVLKFYMDTYGGVFPEEAGRGSE